jgi:DNA-directed RNA polymerase delta subunit
MNNFQLEAIDTLSKTFISKAEELPISVISLPARARHALDIAGAKTCVDAVQFILNNFHNSPGLGTKTITESQEAIAKFIVMVEESTHEDLQKLIDPRESYFSSAQGNLIIAFSGIIETYLQKKNKDNFARNNDILCRRFALHGGPSYTLEDIGRYYDLTRERVRQIESKAIFEIDQLLSGQLKTKEWKIDGALEANYLSVKKQVQTGDFIILKHKIDAILLEKFGETFTPGYLNLFMEVLGYTVIPHSFSGFRGTTKPSWCLASKYQKNEIESIFQALDVIFDNTSSIHLFDLTIQAKKKAKNKLSNDSIHIALKACKEIEVADDSVSVKFCYLKNAADKAYRILEAYKKPLHYSAIAREINLLNKEAPDFKPVKERNLTNQLVQDNRFIAIAKSGEWGLSSWGQFANITIIEAIEKVLHQAGEPMSFQNIWDGVSKLRQDAAKNSLTTYLNSRSDKFTKVGKDKFALTTWRIKPIPKKIIAPAITNSEFFAVIKKVMSAKNPIPLPELINIVSGNTGLSKITVRQRINESTHLETTMKAGAKYKEVFCKDINFEINEQPIKRELLRDKIQNEIRSILFDNPNVPFKKGDLYKEVSKNVECLRPTFYHYLENMEDVRQYQDGNNRFAIHDHKESARKVELNIDQYEVDENLKNALMRPLSELTIDNVDIGLFELGLIFENGLKDYLTKAKEKSAIQVYSKDLGRLTDMINCVVREGVVTKGHHLNTLREERNNRAHGKVPNLKERIDLFNKAHYIADLFIKYIAFFHKKCDEL